jgi:hypothetical protein
MFVFRAGNELSSLHPRAITVGLHSREADGDGGGVEGSPIPQPEPEARSLFLLLSLLFNSVPAAPGWVYLRASAVRIASRSLLLHPAAIHLRLFSG